jgi:hypothetical protein
MSIAQSLGTYSKQPAEVVPAGSWGVDFNPDCRTGETISSATITVSTVTGDTSPLTAGAAVIDGTKVTCSITGGSDGNTYKVTILATSSIAGKYEADFDVIVVAA